MLNHYLIYIGPGMGGGVIAAIVGIFTAFFLALWSVLYYPIKRAFKNKRKQTSKKKQRNFKKH